MKYFFLMLLGVLPQYIHAQGSDDFEDLRRKTESFARMPWGVLRNDLATFTLSGIDEAVGKAPLRKIPFSAIGEDYITIGGKPLTATVQLAPFDKTKHRLDYDGKYLIRIDHRAFYGDYGSIPKTSIQKITVVDHGDTLQIPPAAYADLHDLNFTYMQGGVRQSRDALYLSADGHRIYLYLFCDNNSGSYEVTWIFQDGHYLRRVLDYGFM
ncbi:MAG: hypothetical protein KGM98_04305 [Bacteroidota bacterium]|nr:hypothetical protein [Bacteroidota bacterium]